MIPSGFSQLNIIRFCMHPSTNHAFTDVHSPIVSGARPRHPSAADDPVLFHLPFIEHVFPRGESTKKCKSVHVSPQKKKGTCQSSLTSPAVGEEEEVGEADGPSFPEMAALLIRPKTRTGILAVEEGVSAAVEEKIGLGILIGDGCGGGDGGGVGGGGGGGDDDGGRGDEQFWGRESLDGYYKKMIRKYPEDALLLGNYARFLKEVRGDVVKAEEYCERAILAEPIDGNVLSLYGDLIWHRHRDGPRAQSYFHRAVLHAPNDCSIIAAYANFLWDAGDEVNENGNWKHGMNKTQT